MLHSESFPAAFIFSFICRYAGHSLTPLKLLVILFLSSVPQRPAILWMSLRLSDNSRSSVSGWVPRTTNDHRGCKRPCPSTRMLHFRVDSLCYLIYKSTATCQHYIDYNTQRHSPVKNKLSTNRLDSSFCSAALSNKQLGQLAENPSKTNIKRN